MIVQLIQYEMATGRIDRNNMKRILQYIQRLITSRIPIVSNIYVATFLRQLANDYTAWNPLFSTIEWAFWYPANSLLCTHPWNPIQGTECSHAFILGTKTKTIIEVMSYSDRLNWIASKLIYSEFCQNYMSLAGSLIFMSSVSFWAKTKEYIRVEKMSINVCIKRAIMWRFYLFFNRTAWDFDAFIRAPKWWYWFIYVYSHVLHMYWCDKAHPGRITRDCEQVYQARMKNVLHDCRINVPFVCVCVLLAKYQVAEACARSICEKSMHSTESDCLSREHANHISVRKFIPTGKKMVIQIEWKCEIWAVRGKAITCITYYITPVYCSLLAYMPEIAVYSANRALKRCCPFSVTSFCCFEILPPMYTNLTEDY